MRKYKGKNGKILEKVICNQCKKSLKCERGYLREGCFHGDMVFGYFSGRDGVKHHFDLCESCYNKLISGFAIPVLSEEEKEYLC